ncbi:MAG TPA: PHP domain-containing protein [Candidatus Baltobacteraceae bacterium]
MIVDFHSHTRESDGSLAPQALCDLMVARGVSVFAVTDHDTLAAYGQFEAPANMRVVTGIEINTTYCDNEVHILGYRLPLGPSPLLAVLERNRAERRKRIERTVAQLAASRYPITMQEVEAETEGGSVLGRPHVGKALIRKGLVRDIETAFRTLLRRGKPGYVPASHILPHEAIATILAAGGIPVLAHPGRLHDYDIIDELARHGLRGLEVFYPSHEPAQVQYFRDRAGQHGLVMTGGSDFHDIRYHKRGVGMDVEKRDIEPFLELVS